MNPLRWWVTCALGRGPLLRRADRVHAWGLVIGFAAMIAAIAPAVAVGQVGYTARAQTIAAEAATRHPAEAIAMSDSTADPTQIESGSTSFLAHVRWTARDGAHDDYTKLEQPVKAGQPVRIWLDDAGKPTTPPLTDADARVVAMGTAAIVWLGLAAVIGVGVAMLQMAVNRARDRKWERGLRALVDDVDGPAPHRP
ncbi:hypothetical protein H7K45_15060 [Mycobacterium yunnanensis]|uniref:Transmembrane protein n=1 Tax=Mycobacterium yunnanensis TaxID=368477 RepID=A0A9X3C3C7_9MYCO|nr:hypothetical protein [Mycobacterium yunnanensis]MCV7421867.1 hypothetical protein [Mycobacterium yunnanensis]